MTKIYCWWTDKSGKRQYRKIHTDFIPRTSEDVLMPDGVKRIVDAVKYSVDNQGCVTSNVLLGNTNNGE